jgi:tRNA (guanine-N7-)-methyltransferase
MARRLAKTEERNIRLIEARAEEVVRDALADASVEAFWINFPDPWPKKRHHRRRLLQPGLVAALARRLVPGGELQAATDHAGYAAQIDAVLAAEPLLENALPAPFVSEVPGRLRTAYEEMWRAEGRALHFFHYRRRSDA